MHATTKERITLIAAVIAAMASITAAFLSSVTNRSVAEYSAVATAERERESFRRSQIDRLVTLTLEAAIHLQAQYNASHNVPWIVANPEASLASQAFQAIEQIRFSLASLVAMGVVPQEKLVDAERLLSSLRLDWHSFSSARAAYRDAVNAGIIKMSGQASDKARVTEKRYLEMAKNYEGHLRSLRELTASVNGAVGGTNAAQPGAAGNAPKAAPP